MVNAKPCPRIAGEAVDVDKLDAMFAGAEPLVDEKLIVTAKTLEERLIQYE